MKLTNNNILLFLVFMAFSCKVAENKLQEKAVSTRPNIVFILADDLGYGDIGAYGQTAIKTPNLDRMAAAGRQYMQFYAGSTVCAPSRASLMTGQHTGHTYIRGNGEVPMRATDISLPKILRKNGYATGMVGKWGLGLEGTTGVPEKQGWDFFTGHLHHIEGHFQQSDSLWKIIDGTSKKVALSKDVYVNELFTDEALQFIEDNSKKPFFLYVSYTLPHAELKVHDRYLRPYLTPEGESKFASETPHPSGKHYGPQPYPKAAYAAMVSSIDDYVGQIMKKIEEQGLAENTLIIFTSDNGTHIEGGRTIADAIETFQSSGPLRGVKRDLYEGGIRVPFIGYWKGQIKPGSISNHISAFWDTLPTFVSLTGGELDAETDGLSFASDLLEQEGQKQHKALYWEFSEGGFKQAVRQGNWKAIRFYKNGQPERTELYRLDKDIGEKNNIAASNPAKVKELEQLMDQEHTASENNLFRIR